MIKKQKMWIRFWYDDGKWKDIEVSHCICKDSNFNLDQISKKVTFFTESEIDEYDNQGN